jgi:hypothetical protein
MSQLRGSGATSIILEHIAMPTGTFHMTENAVQVHNKMFSTTVFFSMLSVTFFVCYIYSTVRLFMFCIYCEKSWLI